MPATDPSPAAATICMPPQVQSPAANTPSRFIRWCLSTIRQPAVVGQAAGPEDELRDGRGAHGDEHTLERQHALGAVPG